MSKKYIFILLFIFFLSLIILNISITTVYATIYRIIDTEGNTIRVTTEPQMKKSEEEAGCTLSNHRTTDEEIRGRSRLYP
jgi:exopolysaccharide biosynthesis protein